MKAGPSPSPATFRGSGGRGPMPPAPRRCPRRRRSATAAGSEGKGTIQGEAGFLPRRPHGAACGAGGQLWQRAAGSDRQRPGAGKPAATLPAGLRVLGRRPGLGKGLPFAAPPGVPPCNPKGSGGETKAGEKGAERPRGKKSSKPPCGLFARAIGRSAKPWRRPLLAASPPRARRPRHRGAAEAAGDGSCSGAGSPRAREPAPGGLQEPTASRPPAPLEGASAGPSSPPRLRGTVISVRATTPTPAHANQTSKHKPRSESSSSPPSQAEKRGCCHYLYLSAWEALSSAGPCCACK